MLAARIWAALAAGPLVAAAQGTFRAPSYTAGSIINAASNEVGPFAANTFVSIYGDDLSVGTAALSQGTSLQTNGPLNGGVNVLLGLTRAYLYYVSPHQVNFLIPSNFTSGRVDLRVVRENLTGAAVSLNLQSVAPALFELKDRFVIATTTDFRLIDPQNPAKGGDVVILWATGLGATIPAAPVETVALSAAKVADFSRFRVWVNGKELAADQVFYAGLSPGYAGLYQINLRLPADTPPDPEIVVGFGEVRSAAGRRLFVR